jgi:hypothetical protein
MADDIARLGIEIDASQADKAKVSLDALAVSGGKAEASTASLGKASAATAAETAAYQAKVIAATVAQTGMTQAQAAAALGFKDYVAATQQAAAATSQRLQIERGAQEVLRLNMGLTKQRAAEEAQAAQQVMASVAAELAIKQKALAEADAVAQSSFALRMRLNKQQAADTAAEATAQAAAAAEEQRVASAAQAFRLKGIRDEIAALQPLIAARAEAAAASAANAVQGAHGFAAGLKLNAPAADAAAAAANAEAMLALGKATATEAAESVAAATARSNVAAVMALGVAPTRAATEGMHALGSATKLTNMQMQELTGIARHSFDALAVGANPLTVLTSHAASLGQALAAGPGGVTGALGILATTIVPVAAGIAATVGPVALLAIAFAKGAEEAAHLNNELAVTNGFTGLTASSYEDMAQRIAKATDTGIGKTKSVMDSLIGSGKLTGDVIEQVTAYSEKLAELTGKDAVKIAAGLENMGVNVAEFAAKHALAYHDLTADQIRYIDQVQKQSGAHAAELIMMKEINGGVQGLTVQYGILEKALHTAGTAASNFWDSLMGAGRPQTLEQQLKDAQEALGNMKAGLPGVPNAQLGNMPAGSFLPGGSGASPTAVAAQQKVVGDLLARVQKEQADAAAKAKAQSDEADRIQKLLKELQGHKAAPTDETDQKTSSVDAAVAQAQTAQLQAILGLNTDIEARASIQKQIAASEEAVKSAQIDRQKAEIDQAANQGHITRAVADELMSRLDGVKLLNENTAALKQRLADEQAHDLLIRQELDIAQAQRDAQASILQAQQVLARNAAERQAIELKLIDLAADRAKAEAEATLASALASKAQKAAAQIVLDNLPKLHGLQVRAENEQGADAIAREILSVETGRRQALIGLLESQRALADYGFQQRDIDLNILKLQQQIEKLKLEEVVNSKTSSDAEKKIAQAQLDVLGAVQANQIRSAQGSFLQSYDNITGAINNMASAFSQHDWVHASTSLIDAIGSAGQALGPSGLGSVLSSVASSLSQLAPEIAASIQIGQAGGVAFAKATGGNSENAKTGGFFGLIGGIIGSFFGESDAAIQKRKTENAAASTAADAAWQAELKHRSEASQQEIALAILTGDTIRVTNLQRQQELSGLEAASRARQEEIYRLQDQAEAANTALSTAVSQMTNIHDAAKQASQSLGAFYASLTDGFLGPEAPPSANTPRPRRPWSASTRASRPVINRPSATSRAPSASSSRRRRPSPRTSRPMAATRLCRTLGRGRQGPGRQPGFPGPAATGRRARPGLVDPDGQRLRVDRGAGGAGAPSGADRPGCGRGPGRDTALGAGGAAGDLQRFSQPDYAYYVQHNPDLYAQFQAQTGFARKRSISEYGQLMWTSFDNTGRQFTPYGQKFAAGGLDGSVGGGSWTSDPSHPASGRAGRRGRPGEIMPVRRGLTDASAVAAAGDNAGAGWAAVVNAINALGSRVDRVEAQTRKTANILQHVSRDGEAFQTQLNVPSEAA